MINLWKAGKSIFLEINIKRTENESEKDYLH